MNKSELLEKGGSVRKRGAVLVPAIFTRGIRIPAFLTLLEPKKISEPTNIDVRITGRRDRDTPRGSLAAEGISSSQERRPAVYTFGRLKT